jgi:predicted kinase
VVAGNLEDAAEGVGEVQPRFAYDAVRSFCHLWFERHRRLLKRRVEERRIRDGHGDLRPDHIHLGSDSVCIYDCIEFNDGFRHADVAADSAFLAMELDLAGRPELSRCFVQGLARALDDRDIHRLMDFYECHRAMVRARVEFLRTREKEVAPAEREASFERASRYARLALGYALSACRPLVLVVMGRIGTGKSTMARGLAEALGWPVVASDHLRKQLVGLPLEKRPSKKEREFLYSRGMSDRVYQTMLEEALETTRRDRSVILDATFARQADRDRIRMGLEGDAASPVFVELTAPDSVVRSRLEERESQQAVVSDARAEDFARLSEAYEPPDASEGGDVLPVDAGGPRDSTLQEMCRRLVERRVKADTARGER